MLFLVCLRIGGCCRRRIAWRGICCGALLVVCLSTWEDIVRAQGLVLPRAEIARSRSGQFLVFPASPSSSPLRTGPVQPGQPKLELNASLLAVSCERVKEVILNYLRIPDQWRHPVRIFLYRARTARDPVRLIATWHPDGWNYRIEIPERVEEEVLIRTLSRVVVQEIIQRPYRKRSIAVPTWLNEALTAHLMVSLRTVAILRPETFLLGERLQSDPVHSAYQRLHQQLPMSYQGLVRPPDLDSSVEIRRRYQASAQVFLDELLDLDNGRMALHRMMIDVGRTPDWETAFLKAFAAHFKNPTDVEMWWAVILAHLRTQGIGRSLNYEVSLSKLDSTLTVYLPGPAGAAPELQPVTVTGIMEGADWNQHQKILPGMINRLEMLRLVAEPQVANLAQAYHQTLEDYLRERQLLGQSVPRKGRPQVSVKVLTRRAMRQLRQLQQHRDQLNSAASTSPAS